MILKALLVFLFLKVVLRQRNSQAAVLNKVKAFQENKA